MTAPRSRDEYWVPIFNGGPFAWKHVTVTSGVTETEYHLTPAAKHGLTIWTDTVPMKKWWQG